MLPIFIILLLGVELSLCVHPFQPLSYEEIESTTQLIKRHNEFSQMRHYIFNQINLIEPPKSLMQQWSSGRIQEQQIPRKSLTTIINKDNNAVYEVTVDLKKNSVESVKPLPKGIQPTISPDEYNAAINATLHDPEVIKRAKELGLNPHLLSVEPLPVGYQTERDLTGKRLCHLYFYFRNSEYQNQFAHPLNFMAFVDINKEQVVKIEELPIFANSSRPKLNRVDLVKTESNYFVKALPRNFFRQNFKPLLVKTVGGPSFTLSNDNELTWQKFSMRIGFNTREGLVIHDVHYNDGGKKRSLIYRMAMSEMVVPYGDPRYPYNLKSAFDQGENGLGFLANELRSDIDCMPDGKMLSFFLNNNKGEPDKRKNAVCIHEVDGGLLHKHTDNLNPERVTIARQKNLEIHFIITAGNYEYQFSFTFHLDAVIRVEARASGILSTNLLLAESIYGTTVLRDGIATVDAQVHQHIFNVRIDPAFDGESNSVSTLDVHALSGDVGSKDNPYGNGFKAVETPLTTSKQAITDIDVNKERTWKIFNPNSINPITKKPVSWKLIPGNHRLLLAKPGSAPHKRAGFATHAVWVTDYKDGELYAAGEYVTQSQGEDGLPKYANRNANIVNKDIVIWHSFCLTHVPRVEDFPIMGVESVGFWLKPNGFFNAYPGVDVPGPPGPDSSSSSDGPENIGGQGGNRGSSQNTGGSNRRPQHSSSSNSQGTSNRNSGSSNERYTNDGSNNRNNERDRGSSQNTGGSSRRPQHSSSSNIGTSHNSQGTSSNRHSGSSNERYTNDGSRESGSPSRRNQNERNRETSSTTHGSSSSGGSSFGSFDQINSRESSSGNSPFRNSGSQRGFSTGNDMASRTRESSFSNDRGQSNNRGGNDNEFSTSPNNFRASSRRESFHRSSSSHTTSTMGRGQHQSNSEHSSHLVM